MEVSNKLKQLYKLLKDIKSSNSKKIEWKI
jgi:hypothetical protein